MQVRIRSGNRVEVVQWNSHHEDLKDSIKLKLKYQLPKRVFYLRTDSGRDLLDDASLRTIHQSELLNICVKQFEIGDYVCLGEQLGGGSFSQVFRGVHKRSKTEVAIKVVDRALLNSQALRDYHEREKKIISKLHHRNIVTLYDILEMKEDDGGAFLYFVMEYCRGGSLENHVRGKRMPEEQARRLLGEIADAMRYLVESEHVVHRDLKPQNILLTLPDLDRATIKLCDFGFSRTYDAEAARPLETSWPNTPLYASPEVLYQRPYDNRCDLWSIGAIFYEMLVGQPLFNVQTRHDLDMALRQKQHINIPSNLHLSLDCMELLRLLLERDETKRFSWAAFLSHPYLPKPVEPVAASVVAPEQQAAQAVQQAALPPASPAAAKRIVYFVPAGDSYEVDISKELKISSLKRALASDTHIPRADQLLLIEGGDELLDEATCGPSGPRSPTSAATEASAAMYLFDQTDLAPQPAVTAPPPAASLPPVPSVHAASPLLDASPLRPLLELLHEFRSLAAQAEAHKDVAEKSHQFHKDTLMRMHSQAKGHRVLMDHVTELQRGVERAVTSVRHVVLPLRPEAERLFAGFHVTVHKLSKIALDPALRTGGRATLLQCIDEVQARADLESLRALHDAVQQLFNQYDDVRRCESTSGGYQISGEIISDSRRALSRSELLCTQINNALVTYTANGAKVAKEIERVRATGGAVSNDNVDGFREMARVGREQLEQAHNAVDDIQAAGARCVLLKAEVFQKIRFLMHLRKEFRRVQDNVTVLAPQRLTYQRTMQGLQHVMGLEQAYAAYLAEMARRAARQASLQAKAQRLNDRLKRMTDEESARLKSFAAGPAQLLPAALFPFADASQAAGFEPLSVPSVALPVVQPPEQTVDLLGSNEDFDDLVKDDYDDLKREIAAVRAQLNGELQSKQQANVSELLQENENLKATLKDRMASLEQYETSFRSLNRAAKDAQDREDSWRTKAAALQERVAALEQAAQAALATHANGSQAVQALQQQLNKVLVDHSLPANDAAALRGELARETRNSQTAIVEVQALRSQCAALQFALSQQAASHTEAGSALNEKLVASELARSVLQAQLKDLSVAFQQQQADLQALTKLLDETVDTRNTAVEECSRTRQRLDSFLAQQNFTECPICNKPFPNATIAEHANICPL
eukprot:TRINITY_DN371_c0_g1_i2.p1 TRINITY_DN371_c0_g1~~TRINITY_DN371_c0_g1_i2.p1  ORF type:complete len:1160 (-),score=422.52 TRINITY_DN371_c0_g1_i2:215-3694(-)